jgi:carbon-monoxide dehydrogenase medium subunit
MKPCAFTYYDPATVEDAVALLASKENARLLAGGQSLVPMMNFRYVLPDVLIDINGIKTVQGISVSGNRIAIGGGTRQRTLEYSEEIRTLCPLMAEAIPHIGHRQTRNRGTIGGSLAHADPAAELLAVAVALDAEIEAASTRGRRTIPASEFVHGFMTTALEPDEMLTRVTLPVWPRGHGYSFMEFARRRGDFALGAAAVLLALGKRGEVERVSITVAAVGPRPVRRPESEQSLLGQIPTPELIAQAAERAGDTEATTDVHAGAEYRQHLARVMTRRALTQAVSRVGGHA